MAEKKPSILKLLVGYALFSVWALVTAFFLTFPYDAVKERTRQEAEAAGYFLRIGSMGPGFLAVKAKDVQLSRRIEGDSDKPPEALKIDSVSVGPTLFPPGLGVTVSALGGTAQVRASGITSTRVRVDLDELDLSKGNLKGFTGVDFAGTVDAHVDLTMPRTAIGNAPAEPDLGQASGTVSIETRNLAVNGGTMTVTIAQFGPEPTPLDLPKIVIGDLSGHLKFEKGAGTIEDFKAKSADLELNATGTVKLAKRLEYSEPTVEVRFKADPEFQKRLGLIGSALSMVGSDPKDPTWRMGRLGGYLSRPAFR